MFKEDETNDTTFQCCRRTLCRGCQRVGLRSVQGVQKELVCVFTDQNTCNITRIYPKRLLREPLPQPKLQEASTFPVILDQGAEYI